jgi:hypothetical protein
MTTKQIYEPMEDQMGGGWLGGGWQGGGWQGGGWQGGGWTSGGGGDAGYAMRPDRPLVAEDLTPDGNKTPTFPVGAWDADLFSLNFLPEFFTAKVSGKNWLQFEQDIITALGPPPKVVLSGPKTNNKDDFVDDLRILAVTERPEAMGEILNQHQNQQLCFMQLLTMTAGSHPHTFFALKVAARVAETVMIRLKQHFNRPRPTQYYPALYPPLAVPGHSSYPAGHAVIAQVTANVLIEITKRNKPKSPYEKSLRRLAKEIGMNRVIAGFHFRSDIDAGITAGNMTHEFMSKIPKRAVKAPDYDYHSAIKAAQGEWS